MKVIAFHSFLLKKGGGAIAFQNMLVALRKRGHEISAWTLGLSKDFEEGFREHGIEIHSFGMDRWYLLGRQLLLLNNFRASLLLDGLARRARAFDVAFVHGYEYSPHLASKLDVPTVYYCEEPPRHYHEPDTTNVASRKRIGKMMGFVPNRIDMAMDLHDAASADVILTNSDYSREYVWRTYGKMPVTVYLGVDSGRFRPLGLEKENMVLAVGGNYYLKAHDFVVRSLARVPEGIRPSLTIVGKGDRQEEFLRMAGELGVKVEVMETASDERIVELYNRARATVIAYIMEPFGLVAIESMACGTPVVAVREGGLRESVVPGTGILTGRHEDDFAAALERILRNPKEAATMGRAGREHVVSRFTWERCGADLERVLEGAVRRGRARA